jgi:hypothetical protein
MGGREFRVRDRIILGKLNKVAELIGHGGWPWLPRDFDIRGTGESIDGYGASSRDFRSS